MMDLYERLRARKEQAGTPPTAASTVPRIPGRSADAARDGARADPSSHLDSHDWQRVADFVWSRKRRFGVQPLVGGAQGFLLEVEPEGLIFFDTETTGLSGGSGTMVFLIGLGRIDGEELQVEQVFLSDYPGEPALLSYLQGIMPEDATYVSYNGKAFDFHLLAMRHLLQGREVSYPRQLDLLYPARRLWRTLLDSCSLSDIEKHVLGVHRSLDIPGFLIPDTYFEFLKTGDACPLEPVFEHHSQDVVSLHKLLVSIERVARDPDALEVDLLQLGRMLLHRYPVRGEFLLRRLSETSSRAGLELAYHLRRSGRTEESFEVFFGMYRSFLSPVGGIEAAKHLEHRRRELCRARDIVGDLLVRPDCVSLRDQLRRRSQRLERKIERAAGR